MLKFMIFAGVAMMVIGLGAVVARKKPNGSSWFADKFGESWESSFAGMWLGWKMVAVGAILVYFALSQKGGARIFTETSILGTLAVIGSIVAMIAKSTDSGRAWFAKKLGDNWEKDLKVQFLGWPMMVGGLFMWLPDHLWWDAVKFLGVFIAFWIWRFFDNKKKASSTIITPPPPAFTEAVGGEGEATPHS